MTHVETHARTSQEATAQTFEAEAPPGTDTANGPDRTSEAHTETDATAPEATSLLAMSLGLVAPAALAQPTPSIQVADAPSGPAPAIEAGGAATTDIVAAVVADASGGDLETVASAVDEGVLETPDRTDRTEGDKLGEARRREGAGRPDDQLGAVVRDLPVEERHEVASAWNRAGGRFETADEPSAVTPTAPNPADSSTASERAVASGDGAVAPTDEIVASGDGAASGADTPPLADSQVNARDLGTDEAVPGERVSDVTRRAARRLEGTTPAEGTESGPQVVHASHTASEPARATEGAAPVAATPTPVDARDPATMARQIGDTVIGAVRSGTEVLRLVLNPPELGHLDIRVQQTDGGLRVHLATATAEARDALELALPTLVSGLEARSIRVEHAEVRHASGTDTGRWTGDSSQARQRGEGNDGQAWERPDWSSAAALEQPLTGRDRARSVEQLLDLVA